MSALREAAQQALEALKFSTPNPRSIDDDYAEQGWKEHNAAITALRAALGQQAEPAQEPVAICCNCLGTKRPHADDPEWKGRCDCEPPQLAEPAQEPVAWRSENANPPGGYVIFQQYPQALADLGKPIQPLYTAPPQRKPLTKERLLYIYNQLPNWGMDMDRLPQGLEKFARAIENASWEKNHGQT